MRTEMTRQARSRSSPKLRDFSASLPMMLLRTREAVMGRFRAMLRDNGLTEQQWRVLRALGDGATDGSHLTELTYLLAPSLTRILRDLEAQALITSWIDPTDQRRKLVDLTPNGRTRIELIAPMSVAIYADIAARFGRQRLSDLEALLEELRKAMQ